MKQILVITALSLFISSCRNEKIETGLIAYPECKRLPNYINNLGFNPGSTAFSTSERKIKGICLVDISQPGKIYMDSTWDDYGSMGPLSIDQQGNAYAVPVPFVNVLDNKKFNQNTIYKIDALDGKLKPVIVLEKEMAYNPQNAYGLVGLFYDCQLNMLYASSIYGSDRDHERGRIYCIDLNSNPAKVSDKLENIDAFGLGIAEFNGKKTLFFGTTRSEHVYRIGLDENGKFKGEKKYCFSLAGVGKRGDDKVKKIRFAEKNMMLITGAEFYNNLTAPTQNQEDKYEYYFDMNEEKWVSVSK